MHLKSLAAMKQSEHYDDRFEEDVPELEDVLNKINSLFDVWIDMQRRWVELEGLFNGSADIATLLPVESNLFSSVSDQFLALMKQVEESPRVLEVVQIEVCLQTKIQFHLCF
jgi:dynein heavy chain 1